jgi:integrase
MAHIQRLGSKGAYRYKVRYLDPAKVERSKTFVRKTDADNFLTETTGQVQRGAWVDPSAGRITLENYGSDWLAHHAAAPSSLQALRSRWSYLEPLRPLPLAAIQPSLVRSWLAGLTGRNGNHLADGTRRQALTLLSQILDAAVDDRRLLSNPCRAKSVKAPEQTRRRRPVWSDEYVSNVLGALPARYEIVGLLCAHLGLRQGEALGLALDDLDPLRKVVHVRRQVTEVNSRLVFKLPKCGKVRDVPLTGGVLALINLYLESFPARAATLPWEDRGGEATTIQLLVTSREHKPVNRNHFNAYVWWPALEKVGIPHLRSVNGTHALRHWYASMMLAGGLDIRALSEYLGHSDPGFTLRVYTHLIPSAADTARAAMDRALAVSDGLLTASTGQRAAASQQTRGAPGKS